jgi:hypothetical protein
MRIAGVAAAAVAAAIVSGAGPALAQGKRFDGSWSVEVVTQQGACDRAYRYAMIVENGVARYAGPEAFQLSARVHPDGTVAGAIVGGPNRADFKGRLSGGLGSGLWAMTGSRACRGLWNAERRG